MYSLKILLWTVLCSALSIYPGDASTTVPTTTVDPCFAVVGCQNGASCYLNNFGYWVCNCTVGFGGPLCAQSAVIALENSIALDLSVDVQDAEQYAEEAKTIIDDQLAKGYSSLDASATSSTSIGASLVTKAGLAASPGDNLTSLTTELTSMTSTVFSATSACATTQISGCTLDSAQTKDIIDKTEENLGNMIHLMLNTQTAPESPIPISKDNISITVFKSKGADLPFDYNTDHGSLTLPFWETFQGKNKGKEVLLSLISYESSPYVHSPNKDDVTSSVVKVNATRTNGKELNLDDPDDPISMSIDTSSVFSDETTWLEMEEFKSVEGTFMLVAFFNYSVNAIIVEIRIKTLKVCNTYAKYGHAEPSESDFDVSVETKGKNKIKDFRPDGLAVDFQDQVLRLTFVNENTLKIMDPIVVTILCEDYKLGSFGLPIHEYRIADVDVRYYNKELGTWNKSTELKASAPKGKSVGFKSNFFGTFSANVLFIPPEPIDFASIFLNFHERLAQTPHSLAVSVGLFVLFILITIPLYRLDRKDALLWSYLPLVDNPPDAEYVYEVAVYTGIRSARRFTAIPYINVQGKDADTGIRILLDGQRENFARGTSSHFSMRTLVHLGQLTELKIWHDNSGDSPKWLLSRIIIYDQHADERYVFLSGNWLAMDRDDGRTWRKLFPAEPDVLDGNLMFNELSKRQLFDDHLWLSLSMRPNYSRFNRVQRLWTIVALLFLSMIASAMWYNTTDPTGGSSINIGPIKLNYKIVYVGFMSALIAAVPSLLIMSIFRYRRTKGEGQPTNKVKDNSEMGEKIFEKTPRHYQGLSASCVDNRFSDEGFGSMADIESRSDFELQSVYSDVLENTQANTAEVTSDIRIHQQNVGTKIIEKERKMEGHTVRFCDNDDNILNKNTLFTEIPIANLRTLGKVDIYSNILQNTHANVSCVKDCTLTYKEDAGSGEKKLNDHGENEKTFFGEIERKQTEKDKQNVKLEKENTEKVKAKVKKKRQCLLPWWFIFLAYFLVLACIGASSFFTFLYTLEWGPDKTVEWMMAFFIGTLQSVFIIEPFKAFILALLFVCCCKRIAVGKLGDVDKSTMKSGGNTKKEKETNKAQDEQSVVQLTDISLFECPDEQDEDNALQELKRKALLDRRLLEKFRLMICQFIYIVIIAIICSHNVVTTSYYQNTELADCLKSSYKPNVSDDIWDWLESYFVNTTFPKWYYNDEIRPAYVQRFLKNAYNLRLGYARIRQVRVKGSCSVVGDMADVVTVCPHKYTLDTEETGDFCVDWVPFNGSCFDENEETDYSFLYSRVNVTKTLSFAGKFATYGGGGYFVDVGPKQSLALEYIQRLRSDTWIDNNTRAVFADAITFNANTRIFTHHRAVFEIPEFGGIFMDFDIWSANLYPYITSWDYVVLGFQVLFVIIIFIRLVLFLVNMCRMRQKCCSSMAMWIRLLEILFAAGAITSYIMRIDHTISAIETVFNNFGRYSSFEIIHILDVIYKCFISAVMFIVILELLKPLTFNYYLYLMRTSVAISGKELFGMFFILMIPMVAFASLFYLLIGNMEEDYRDLPNSLLSLFLILIGMIDLSETNEFGDILINFIYGSYTIILTMILISVFISILSIGYNEVKAQNHLDNENAFDKELSEHFVNKITSVFSNFIKAEKPKQKEDYGDVLDCLMAKIKIVEKEMMELNKAEVRYHKKLAYGVFGKSPPIGTLSCMISWENNCAILTYANKRHLPVVKISIHDETWEHKIDISICTAAEHQKEKFPFDVDLEKRSSVFKVNSAVNLKAPNFLILDLSDYNQSAFSNKKGASIYASYDDCETWRKCETQDVYPSSYDSNSKLRAIFEQLPTHFVALQNDDNTDPESQESSAKFHLQTEGGEYVLSDSKKIVIKVEPGTVNTSTNILSVMVKPFGITPLLELTPTEEILKPLKVTLPLNGQLDEATSEFIVLLKQGQGDWIKSNVLLEVLTDSFQFSVQKDILQKNIPTTVMIKQSEIGWVDRSPENNDRDLFDNNTIRTISANISMDHLTLAKHLDHSKADIEHLEKATSIEKDKILKYEILQKWTRESSLDDFEKMKKLEEILEDIKQRDLAKWLNDQEFKLRCSLTSKQENVQLIKAINLVSRFYVVARQWQNIAEKLGIEEQFIQSLNTDIPRCCEEKCSLVLFYWYRNDRSATVEKLCKIMLNQGFKIVADNLRKIQ